MKYFISRGLLKDNPYEIARFLEELLSFTRPKCASFCSPDKTWWSTSCHSRTMLTHSFPMLSGDSSPNLKPQMTGATTYK